MHGHRCREGRPQRPAKRLPMGAWRIWKIPLQSRRYSKWSNMREWKARSTGCMDRKFESWQGRECLFCRFTCFIRSFLDQPFDLACHREHEWRRNRRSPLIWRLEMNPTGYGQATSTHDRSLFGLPTPSTAPQPRRVIDPGSPDPPPRKGE